MRIGIVGSGALGSVVGCLLIEAGMDVVMIERDQEEVHLVQEKGLLVEGVTGKRTVRPSTWANPADAGKVDLAILLVKSYDTAPAVATLKQIVSEDGVVLTLQNGIGNYETLEEAFPGRVLLGTTTMGAMSLGPAAVRHTGFGDTHLGEADGSIRERTKAVGEALGSMKGGAVHVVDNAVGCVWSKLIVNAAINAPATLLRVRNGDLPATEAGRSLIHDIVEECVGITRARGIRLVFENPEERVVAVCQGTAPNVNSMFQDILAGRRTEIDFINGAIARESDAVGIPATVNKTLTNLIKALEISDVARIA